MPAVEPPERQTPESILLEELMKNLNPEYYQKHGDSEVDSWGSSQWVMYEDTAGAKHYLRVQIIKHD